MKILLFMNDTEAKQMSAAITHALPGTEVRLCASADSLFRSVPSAYADAVILDAADMKTGERLMEQYPYTNLIFVSSERDPAADAFAINASGFLLRPVEPEMLKRQLRNLRYPREKKCRVRFQCFGNFDVFVDEQTVHFKYRKTREMLAFLVSRNGALCSNGQIMAALWEDETPEAYLRKLKKDLKDTFAALGCEETLVMQRGAAGIDMNKVTSDYRGTATLHPGADDFMMQYSWSEEINAAISKL